MDSKTLANIRHQLDCSVDIFCQLLHAATIFNSIETKHHSLPSLIKAWEAGEEPIPTAVIEQVQIISSVIETERLRILDTLTSHPDKIFAALYFTNDADFKKYRFEQAKRCLGKALAGRLALQAAQRGWEKTSKYFNKEVVIQPIAFVKEPYEHWLEKQHGTHSKSMLIRWTNSHPTPDESIQFGGLPVDLKSACKHFMFAGSTGSGKTVSIRLLLQSLWGDGRNSHTRGVVYDPHGEYYALLKSMGIAEDRLVVLNPFATDAKGWDMAADIQSASQAETFANALLPYDGGNQDPFWRNSSILLTKGVILSFIIAANNKGIEPAWTLRDL